MGTTLTQSAEKKPGTRTGRPNYPRELRERLAAATCEPGVSVATLARENGINANMLFTLAAAISGRSASSICRAHSGRIAQRHADGGHCISAGRSASAGREACITGRHDRDPDRSCGG
nr:transposase [Paraburkholderia youngii]